VSKYSWRKSRKEWNGILEEMQMFFRGTVVTGFALISLLTSCRNSDGGGSSKSRGGSDSIAEDQIGAFNNGLVGIWATDCYPIPNNDSAWVRYEYRFAESQFINRVLTYREKECVSIYRDTVVTHTYTLKNPVDYTDIPNTFEMNFIFVKTLLAIYQPDLIVTYNQANGYGYSDWAAGEYKEIGGRAYTPDAETVYHEPGKIQYTIVAYDEAYLVDGDYETGDGQSELTRPHGLRKKNPFFRRNDIITNGSSN
jgi:hypothetical protein